MGKDVTLHVRVPSDLHEKLKEQARAEGRTLSGLVKFKLNTPAFNIMQGTGTNQIAETIASSGQFKLVPVNTQQ